METVAEERRKEQPWNESARDRARALPRPGYRATVAGLLAVFLLVGMVNAFSYPTEIGYDAEHHKTYISTLFDERRLPDESESRAYYKPPAYYVLAGSARWLGQRLALEEPYRAAQLLNVGLAALAAVLVFATARRLWPADRPLHVLALGFFAFVPGLLKLTAMIHPAVLGILAAAAAVYLTALILLAARFRPLLAGLLAAVLILGVLSLSQVLFAYAAVVVALLIVAVRNVSQRRAALGTLAVVVLVPALLAAPWYVPSSDRVAPTVSAALDRGPAEVLSSRPLWSFLSLGAPEIATQPVRPHYPNRVIPTTYSDLWGDYFGHFAWSVDRAPPLADLRLQMLVGALPTALALAGWLALVVLVARRRVASGAACVPLVVLPVVALAGVLLHWLASPSDDGDLLKGTYMLTAAPAWALAFGLASSRLAGGRRSRVLVFGFLLLALAADVRFLLYGDRLGGIL
jgi:hypothetical protein